MLVTYRVQAYKAEICAFSLSEAVEICTHLPKRNVNNLHPTLYYSAHWGRLEYGDSEAGISYIAVAA
jgi:hypothetical protein